MSRPFGHSLSRPDSTTTTTTATTSPTPPPLEAKLVLLGAQGVGKTSLIHRLLSPNSPSPLPHTPSTIGASFITHKIHDPDTSTTVRLQIWDTAGQERFRSISRLYYRGAHVGLLCYDITDERSWEDMKGWLRELRENCPAADTEDGLIIHVVGTKSDIVALDPSKREVPFERTIAYVAEQLTGTLSSTTTPPMTLKSSQPQSHSTSLQPQPLHLQFQSPTNPSSKRSSGFWGTEFTPAWSSSHEVSSDSGEGIEEVFRVIARKLVEQRQRRLDRENMQTPGTTRPDDDYFGYNGGTGNVGSFRLGHGDKRRSWLGLPSVGLGIGVNVGDNGSDVAGHAGGRRYDERDVAEARRRGRCC